jgi:hypothetical protein
MLAVSYQGRIRRVIEGCAATGMADRALDHARRTQM